MKTIIRPVFLILFVFLASYLKSGAQSLQLDIMMRHTTTNLRCNESLSNGSSVSFFTAGTGIRLGFNDRNYLTAGIIYDKRGNKQDVVLTIIDEDENSFAVEGTAKTNFTYLTLPVRYNYQIGNKIRFEVGAGFYAALLLKQELSQRILFFILTKENQTDLYKRMDFGLSGSLTLVLPAFEKSFLRLGVENNLGLINVSDVPVMNNGSIKHNSFNAVITWTQVLGKR